MNDNIPPTAEQQAADLAAQFEGFSATPYLDTIAQPPVWTIGYGSIRVGGDGEPVTADTPPIDEPTGRAWLAVEMAQAVRDIAYQVTVPLTQDQVVALADFIYNLGDGNFLSSTLLRLLNRADYAGAAAEFEKWDHAGGKVVAGLLRRRLAEEQLFQQGMTSEPTA